LEQHIEDVSVRPASGQRILIADDNEVVRKGVCNILRSGLKVEAAIEAVNGKEAVEKARELNPDLVILDMAMPVLDGFSAAERIKKALRSVPIFHVLEARRTRGDPGLSRSAVSRYFPGRMYRLQKLPSAFDWSESAAVFTTKGPSRSSVISTQACPYEASSAFVTWPQTVPVHSGPNFL
jgi:CheY-like chemotaxis protein